MADWWVRAQVWSAKSYRVGISTYLQSNWPVLVDQTRSAGRLLRLVAHTSLHPFLGHNYLLQNHQSIPRCDLEISPSVAGATGQHLCNYIHCNLDAIQWNLGSWQSSTAQPFSSHCWQMKVSLRIATPRPLGWAGHVIQAYLTSRAPIMFHHRYGALHCVVCMECPNWEIGMTSTTVCSLNHSSAVRRLL
jgi:hypothetical protein